MRFSIKLCLLLSFILVLNACKKDPEPGPQACLKLYDATGNATGTSGDCSNDNSWGESALSNQQLDFLDFVDNVSTTNTQVIALTGINAYPIPVQIGNPLNFILETTEVNKSSKIKMAITDSNNNSVEEIALTRVTGIPWQINITDALYNSGEYYRVHYQVSADGSPNYFEGYGDFLVCDAANPNCYE